MKYNQLKDGLHVNLPAKKGFTAFKQACCDCGLVHVVMLTAKDLRGLRMTSWRDKRATAGMRRAPHACVLQRSAAVRTPRERTRKLHAK